MKLTFALKNYRCINSSEVIPLLKLIAGFYFLCSLLFQQPAVSEESATGARRFSYTENRSISWESGRSLEVSETNGEIFVRGSRKNEIEVKGIKTAYAADLPTAKQSASQLRISIDAPGKQFTVKTLKPSISLEKDADMYIDYSIIAPEDINMKLETVGGAVDIASMDGNVDVSTASGAVMLRRVAGALTARSLTGNISATDCQGMTYVSTKSGNVSISFGRPLTSQEVAISSIGGDIKVEFPDNFKATFDISSKSGEINVLDTNLQPASPVKSADDKTAGAETKRYESHGGGPVIRITTVSGKVSLKYRKFERPPYERREE